MKQADLGLNLSTKRKRGRPPFAEQALLRIHFMQQWFGLSEPAMEEALHDVPLYREFAGLDNWTVRLPDESPILRFRHLLEKHKLAAQVLALVNDILRDKGLMLRAGTVVDATLISAPSSTKNASGERDPEMHQSKKSNQWYFGMKAHIGADAESGPGKRRALDKSRALDALIEQIERATAGIRTKVEHPFRIIKRQFDYAKVRYRGVKKNTAQLMTLFALSNLWMARGKLLGGAK